MATYVYDDFRVTLSPRGDGGYDVRAVDGPTVPSTSASFVVPFTDASWNRPCSASPTAAPSPAAGTTRDVGR